MHDQDLFLERALTDSGRITAEQLQAARAVQGERGVDFTDALVQSGALASRDIALVKADICEAPFIDLADYAPCFHNTRLLPRAVAERHCLFPIFHVDNVVTVVMDDPLNLQATDQVRQLLRCEVDAILGDREQIQGLIARTYSLSGGRDAADDPAGAVVEAEADEESQPVVAAVNHLLADGVEAEASDIHLNPDENELRVRYRVDGVLQERQGPPLSMHADLARRIKVIARLDLTQTRRPQDGKFRFTHRGRPVDVRVSILPTVCGENVVLRLLADSSTIADFHCLGMTAAMASDVESLISQPYGMILVTGPTGSGKTTTLYASLSRINDPSRNIMTIEDPVEIRLPYLRQTQVHPEIGLSFASALRSMLRQDPDVVLVGEIRDEETASIALQAALTGHLVLTTLHTNDAAGAIARLRDFQLPPFVISSAVLGVLAQRLARRVCQHCSAPATVDDVSRERFGLTGTDEFIEGTGCPKCNNTGFRGRVGLYELLRITPHVQRLVEADATSKELRDQAVADGMRLIWEDGLDKARQQLTTLGEVARTSMVQSLQSVRSEAA